MDYSTVKSIIRALSQLTDPHAASQSFWDCLQGLYGTARVRLLWAVCSTL